MSDDTRNQYAHVDGKYEYNVLMLYMDTAYTYYFWQNNIRALTKILISQFLMNLPYMRLVPVS
jgi:hypothetical protein